MTNTKDVGSFLFMESSAQAAEYVLSFPWLLLKTSAGGGGLQENNSGTSFSLGTFTRDTRQECQKLTNREGAERERQRLLESRRAGAMSQSKSKLNYA
jgi:hypothetical protein